VGSVFVDLAERFARFCGGMYSKYDRLFLIAAFVSFVASILLWFLVDKDDGMFVGLWVPSILALWGGVRSVIAAHVAKNQLNQP